VPLTPQEIKHMEFERSWLRGYDRRAVDLLLEEAAGSLEEAYRERADLAERVDELEARASKHTELEALLGATLVSAERAAQDMKEQARRESDVIVQEAHVESRRLARDALDEKRRTEEETRKIRSMLRAALDALEGLAAEEVGPRVEQPVTQPAIQPASGDEIAADVIRNVAG